MRTKRPSPLVLAVILMLTCCADAFSQLETSTWCFGRHTMLVFSGGAPVVSANSGMVGVEGCTTISGMSGPALYANGDTVWNANNQPMPNGTGCMGHWSSTQSALAVPYPGDPTKYYLFHTDANENSGADGVHYSIIDMTLDGGLGDVSTANVPLAAPASEKLAGIRHANGTDYWVLAHALNSANFLAYRVGSTGVAAPVVSSIGPSWTMSHSVGQMKISPDGSTLAMACITTSTDVLLYHFSTATGIVSDEVQLSSDFMYGNYGIEFSPSGYKLYVGCDSDQSIHQFDLSTWTVAAITGSNVVEGNGSDSMGAFQLAPDGKIYAAHCNWSQPGTHLGAIQYPEADGASCT